MLKQRTFIILTRPYMSSTGGRMVAIEDNIGGIPWETAPFKAFSKWTKSLPLEDGVQKAEGSWIEWHRTRSYSALVREVRKLLKDIPRNEMMIVEILDLDTMIVPRS